MEGGLEKEGTISGRGQNCLADGVGRGELFSEWGSGWDWAVEQGKQAEASLVFLLRGSNEQPVVL